MLPGYQLLEKDLMVRCGVSRTPVREAIIRLETEGLIQRHARKGAMIFKPSVSEFLTILEVHANLESFAAGLAAHRISAKVAQELRQSVIACKTHAATHGNAQPSAYYQLNMAFHEIIARAACNDIAAHLVKTNARKLMAYYRQRYNHPDAAHVSAKDHELIAEHILHGRAEEASAAMSQHFNYDRETVMDLLASVR
jgi:DNA-binding GntR family transcriptional regulator